MKKPTPFYLFSFSFLLVFFLSNWTNQPNASLTNLPFPYGVASGDPLSHQVILWTKVEGQYGQRLPIKWTVASDQQMQNIVFTGMVFSTEEEDYSVKVDVKNLQAATTYYYQFECLGEKSVIGRTRTLPEKDSMANINLAIVSCSNFEWGYFNPLAALAKRDSIDAVLHLGDYIYEYQISGYGDTTIGRKHDPPHELLTLDDYRTRYAQYRSTPAFQKVHQMHPFITVWDDHEISNDAYIDGAENHQEEEGDYQQRKAAAKKAYFEWMPVRTNQDNLYRNFHFGQLADLIMLDERLAGRTAPVDSFGATSFQDATRTMLGKEQREWFFEQLKSSTATWKIIGNQVIFSDLRFDPIFPNQPINLDAWDGYPYEKGKVIDFLQKNEISNVIFTTGDTHCSWAFETPSSLADYQKKGDKSLVAVEFGTASISSGNYDEYTSMDTVLMAQQLYQQVNPHLKYVNLHDHGYLLLRLREEQIIAEWYYVDGLRRPADEEKLGKRMQVRKGSHLIESLTGGE